MHPARQQRLALVIFIVFFSSIAIALMVYVLRENLNLFYSPTRLAAGEAPTGKTIRGGGCVVRGSVERSTTSLDVNFRITDGVAVIPVHFNGIPPPLFEEGEAAVVLGQLNADGLFLATQVLAKHDENYMPPEVAAAMEEAGGEHQETCEIMKAS